MVLSWQTFTALVQNSAAAVQGACAQLLDLTTGSVLRAILEANASIALWLQWLIAQVYSLTRAATSQGTDLDSWMADFSFIRLPAVAATGSITFSRYSTDFTALIQPGAQVKTADGTQSFTVTADPTNSAWSASQSGYVVASGTPSVTVPVQAVVAGSGGNVQPNTIALISSAISGIDTVTNAAALTNGIAAETDAAFRARFVLYIAALARGTPVAVASAVADVKQGISYAIAENQDGAGNYKPGNFVVTINDGTGSPSDTLISEVMAAVDAVRPIGATFTVQGPADTTINVNLILTVATGYVKANLIGPVEAAISAYINSVGIGGTVAYTKLAQVAYDTSPGITNVSSLTLNSGNSDVTLAANGAAVVGTVTAS